MYENAIAAGSAGLADSILGPFMILGVTMVATYVGIGFLRVYLRKSKARMEQRAEAAANAPDTYVSDIPRRRIQLSQMVQADPTFEIGQVLNWVRSLHTSTHQARATRNWDPIQRYLSEGAREILCNDVPGLQGIGDIQYSRCRFTALHANTESSGLRVQLHSYTRERRDDADAVWEFEDLWSLTRTGNTWRVLSAERHLRQPLQPPSLERDLPETFEDEIRHDPQLGIQREEYLKRNDLKATERWLQETYRMLYAGLARHDLSDIGPRLSPIAAMEASASMFRFQHFGLRSVRSIDSISSIQLVQCTEDAKLSRAVFRIQARVADYVERSDGSPYGLRPKGSYPVNEYWTLVRTPSGKLLVDWVDADADWVV